MLPSVVPRLTTDLWVKVFPGVWKLLSVLRPPSLSLLSLFLSFIFFSYLFSKTMGFFSGCLMSSASIQKLFCGMYSMFKCSFDEFLGEKVVCLSYSSAILGPTPVFVFKQNPALKENSFPWEAIRAQLMWGKGNTQLQPPLFISLKGVEVGSGETPEKVRAQEYRLINDWDLSRE